MEHRASGWLTNTFHLRFRETLLHTGARYHLLCPVYCLMPDHAHLVWLGIQKTSDQQQATRFLRKHLTPHLLPRKLQRQPHDHVLRENERERDAFQSTCFYIQENPVRKDLVKQWTDYPYTGCMLPGYPELDIRAPDFWLRFWRVYEYVRKAQS
jgi:REP element-mobilizing transposase RayT